MIVTNAQEYKEFINNVLFGTDTLWFEDFKRALAVEGIYIIGVSICPASESHFAERVNGELISIPRLSLYAVGDSAFRLLKVKRGISGEVDPSFKEQINRIWYDICKLRGVNTAEYCGIGAYISVGVAEGIICNNVIRREVCRDEVEKVIFRISGYQPKYVYCSSSPAYNIVFEADDYINADIDGKKRLLTEAVQEIISKYINPIKGAKDIYSLLSVNFYHPKMPNYNGYGLARED